MPIPRETWCYQRYEAGVGLMGAIGVVGGEARAVGVDVGGDSPIGGEKMGDLDVYKYGLARFLKLFVPFDFRSRESVFADFGRSVCLFFYL